MVDMVNRPPHYTKGKIQAIDAIASAVMDLNGVDSFCTANAIKYLWRWKDKGGVEDLRKARWYIDYLIALETTPAPSQAPSPGRLVPDAPTPAQTSPTLAAPVGTPIVCHTKC